MRSIWFSRSLPSGSNLVHLIVRWGNFGKDGYDEQDSLPWSRGDSQFLGSPQGSGSRVVGRWRRWCRSMTGSWIGSHQLPAHRKYIQATKHPRLSRNAFPLNNTIVYQARPQLVGSRVSRSLWTWSSTYIRTPLPIPYLPPLRFPFRSRECSEA